MKTLVVYYSRHGHTKKVGDMIAKILKATSEEIFDRKDRKHIATWFISAFDEELRTPTRIETPMYNPMDFDLVIVGTPIWDGVTPAIRRYLSSNSFKKIAFFITFGASAEDAAYQMQKLSRKPVAVLELQDRQIRSGADEKVKNFCKSLR